MSKGIERITLFKLPDESDMEMLLAKYSTLQMDAKKDSHPYIIKASASRTHSDARNRGITIVAKTTFASLEDMKFYDEECEAHASIKAALKGKLEEPPVTVFMDAA
ncbi:stress responsive A/B barrel domain protein [Patellaria atrata CBS 101060]|uniref:Stress responsive A/B barrel domain protein n=1 Tax=Patellaria atrata CBS 101060 TaxID=1346257 RepID=A0A9P4SGD8_9PEZI|nr:stress responsive A/B barrel domain protein [Patellaria atrata CBS 101060]